MEFNHQRGGMKLARYKRIILCSDGTWLESNQGDKSVPSNVTKIARAIAKDGPDADGNIVKQVVSYNSGLGAGDLLIQKAISGGLGYGIDAEVCHLYHFIANNYELGDELFLFGFSRGAFTVRAVAGLVADIGILKPSDMSRFDEMWRAYRANTNGEPFKNSVWYQNNQDELGLSDIRIKVVGVWDTVGALGVPEWPFVNILQQFGIPINQEYAFYNTKVSKNVDYAFQALAIDEKRLTFPPTLWHRSADGPAIDLKQCWFPGVHTNIGGQAEILRDCGDHEEIGYNTLAWMVDNLSGMLSFQGTYIKGLVEEHRRAMNANKVFNGWGCGPIVDNFSGAIGALFRLLGRADRTPGNYPRDPGDGSVGATDESFHPTVRIRKLKMRDYHAPSLEGYSLKEPIGDEGWMWVKKGIQAVPEYVMSQDKKMTMVYGDGRNRKYGVGESMSRLLCPRAILEDLDRDNHMSD